MKSVILDVPKAGRYQYMEEETPIPPVVPSTVVDNAVKGVQGYQNNYVGNWMYGTNVPGWNDGTLSYSLDGHVTMKFNGTGIEWVTEKGPTHGIVGVSIDGGAETMICLYAPEFVQQQKVWENKELTQAEHTIKLRHTGTKNPAATNTYVITDYFKVYNPQAVPDVPVPPIPPAGDVTVVQPGQSIKTAVENASAGKTIQLLAGVYSENIVNVPIGVHIVAAGSGKTFIDFVGTHPVNSETGIFQYKSTSRVDGNQEVSGFTIRGRYAANGGIITNNRDNVRGWDIRVQECNYFGIWLRGMTGGEWSHLDFFNSSWASVGWCTGELCIGTLTDVSLHHLKIRTDRNTKGYGIKALWPEAVFTNLKIFDSDIDLHPVSLWNNGQAPNISIELAAAHYAGIDIYKNKIRNVLSMAAHRPTKSGRLMIRENDMTEMKSNTTCAIELVCSNVTIKKNNVKGSAMFTGNFQPNGKWVDQIVEDNDYVSNNTNPGYGGVFLLGPDGANMNIINNRLKYAPYTFVKHMGNPASSVIVDSGNTKT